MTTSSFFGAASSEQASKVTNTHTKRLIVLIKIYGVKNKTQLINPATLRVERETREHMRNFS